MRRHTSHSPRNPLSVTPANPRFDKSLRRRATTPLTLIEATTAAQSAAGLQTIAAALHALAPCHSQLIQRVAYQIMHSYSSATTIAQLVATPIWTDSLATPPATPGTPAETALAEPTAKEITLHEYIDSLPY